MFFTIPFRAGWVALIGGVLLFVSEAISAIEILVDYWFAATVKKPERPIIPFEIYPDVDVMIATHNESADLLYKTVNACTFLDYPDKKKVHVYICDDQNRPEIAALAEELGVGYFGLSNNTHAKAGNLNNALRNTTSPLVATFDADMIPRSSFLMKTVPYFFLPYFKKAEDGTWVAKEKSEINVGEKVGFIQTPQSFYNPDLFQYNLYAEQQTPNEQDYFFKEVNVSRNKSNSVIYAGSNTLISRKALEDVNYIATDSITEDFLTGMRIQEKGYQTYAIPDVLAHGLAPNTIKSLIAQRVRWGRGCIQSLRKENIFKKKLKLATKASYLWAALYWWSYLRRFIFVMAPIMVILLNIQIVHATSWAALAIWLPYYLLTNISMRTFSASTKNTHWNGVIDTILFPYLMVNILAEAFGMEKNKFVVTDKKRKSSNKASFYYAIPHMLFLVLSFVAIGVALNQIVFHGAIYSILVFYWLILNTKNLIFAVLFMFDRTNVRTAERFYVKLPVTVKLQNQKVTAFTTDISENGFAFVLEQNGKIPFNQKITYTLEYDGYVAEMQGYLMNVTKKGNGWLYGIKIASITEENNRQYMQIVYDRSHTLPTEFDKNATIMKSLRANVTNKFAIKKQKPVQEKAQVRLNLPFVLGEKRYVLQEFDYNNVQIDDKIFVKENECLTVQYNQDLVLELEPIKTKFGNKANSFKVKNADYLIATPYFEWMLTSWKKENARTTKKLEGTAVISAA